MASILGDGMRKVIYKGQEYFFNPYDDMDYKKICFSVNDIKKALLLDFSSYKKDGRVQKVLSQDLEREAQENFDKRESELTDALVDFLNISDDELNIPANGADEPTQGRISTPQRALFALLVKKNYMGFDSKNKLFTAINADLQREGITTKDIKYDTLNKLFDDSLEISKQIFPNKN